MQEVPLTHEQFLDQVQVLATEARTLSPLPESLPLSPLPESATVRPINIAENATFQVEAENGYKAVLRVHRQGYHSRQAILSELAWVSDLKVNGGVRTPDSITGNKGDVVQEWAVDGMPGARYLVLFEFIEGIEPHPTQHLVATFEEFGEIAVCTHLHSLAWCRPPGFERLVWGSDAVFGEKPLWGDWREAPSMGAASLEILERLQQRIIQQLQAYGIDRERYGPIHADMRLANLLIDNGAIRLLDFDDCGSGWFMYDFAAAIIFMEDHPQVTALKSAWVKGYCKRRKLSPEDEGEMVTIVMLRRMALCAWIGSHREVEIAQELAPVFVPVAVELGGQFLQQHD